MVFSKKCDVLYIKGHLEWVSFVGIQQIDCLIPMQVYKNVMDLLVFSKGQNFSMSQLCINSSYAYL